MLLVIYHAHAYTVGMKVLGIFLLTFMGGTTVALPPTPTDINSAVIVVETNTGQVAYLMQIRTAGITSEMITDLMVWRDNNLKGQNFNYWFPSASTMMQTGIITLIIEFESYTQFYQFNGINIREEPNRIIKQDNSLLFVDRTITLSNPYSRFLDTTANPTAQLLRDFNQIFNPNAAEPKNLAYMFTSSFRRTHVNSDTIEHDLLRINWKYFFYIDPSNPTDIVIHDRFANTPIWYGIAILLTILFMGGLYIVLRRKERHANG